MLSEAIQIASVGKTMRRSGELRYARPDRTTTEPDRLQEAWVNVDTGQVEWLDIPVVIVPRAALEGEK